MSKTVVTRAARDFMDLFAVDERGLSIDGIDMVDLTHRYAALEAALSRGAEPEQPVAFINTEVLAELKKHKGASGTVWSGLYTGHPFQNEATALYTAPIRSAQEAGTPAPETLVVGSPSDEWAISQAQLHSACLSFRHDFGLLDEGEKATVMFQAREWLTAWRKALTTPSPKTREAGNHD